MITSWNLRLLSVMTGALLIASTTLAADIQQMNGPVITPPHTEITLQSGQNYTLFCKGKMPVQLKQQEIPEENVDSLFNMSQRTVNSGIDSEYEVALDLYNVDHFAVGYYACFDSTVNSFDVLKLVLEEPNNTAHISYIYIYVNGSVMFAPIRSYIVAKSESKFLIECKPTTPDVNVTLTMSQNKTPDSVFSRKIGFIIARSPKRTMYEQYKCYAQRGNERSSRIIRSKGSQPLRPQISGGSKYFLQGETFVINCTVKKLDIVTLIWAIPGSWSKVLNETNENNYTVTEFNPTIYSSVTITNASIDDEGIYSCTSKNMHGSVSTQFNKTYLNNFTEIDIINDMRPNPIIVDNTFNMKLKALISSYPPANVTFFLNNATLSDVENKYKTKFTASTGSCIISLMNLDANDSGNYTIVARHKFNKTNSLTWDLRVKGAPRIQFGQNNDVDKRYLLGAQASLVCEVTGYPLPVINWIFTNESGYAMPISKDYQTDIVESLYKVKSVLEIPVTHSGNLTCEAVNEKGTNSVPRNFIVYEIDKGFGIRNSDKTWFSDGQRVELKCFASIYDFVNVTWNVDDYEDDQFVDYEKTSFSYIAKLIIDRITPYHSGNYTCYGIRNNGTYLLEVMSVNVAETRAPTIQDPDGKIDAVLPYQPVDLTCVAEAVPPPQITWYKDGKQLSNGSNNITIVTTYLDYASISSTIKISQVSEVNLGKYECSATSESGSKSKLYDLVFKVPEKLTNKAMIFGVIGAVFTVLILLLAYLTWKIRKEKQFRKELADAGLLHFKKGLTKSINPDLGIDEQAELLPYDEKFEFPPEKLHLGKQLGAGAFGVVYKAEARGIINAEESTTVAVKMVKKSADNMYIKALASELKIMVHLGKHINIVNLLGACTKNVGKRELSVIVEYCKFGNIHNYMQKHREVFIDQLTDNPDKNLGKINRGYSCSSGNSGMHSDYFGSNHTQETDNTFLNTANTNRSGRKVSETGYLQPEWRSNYESDYSFDGRSPRPLFSRDLLAWSFQIARGMEYLASRKVLHGDLAARNILLAEDNVVKICDFGLARSIYKNDEYQKQENSPLPLKWLAIECMTDRIFSTQSDVWSFGIVLWELFSLAKTPYPNINPHCLLQWLSEGNRLEKPPYADDRLYKVMRHCWELKPTARPTFGQLQQLLGSFLEDNVRNHYVDLNAAYMDTNVKRDGEEDYLAMVCAPDYNNLVTPSPHHYVNDARSFFPPTPTQLQHDDEGYLQMSPATRQTIFNARPQGNKFDFDARKLSPRVSEASESTPMLTLNNLPRSGSESDHEGNSSPYLNMCPRIEEETDEVFEMKQNNLKNTQPSAVTNPTYITFSPEDEKKQQNFTNNYINVNAPNGLVT